MYNFKNVFEHLQFAPALTTSVPRDMNAPSGLCISLTMKADSSCSNQRAAARTRRHRPRPKKPPKRGRVFKTVRGRTGGESLGQSAVAMTAEGKGPATALVLSDTHTHTWIYKANYPNTPKIVGIVKLFLSRS